MDRLDYNLFFHYLQIGKCINETCFYFADEPEEEERYLGYIEGHEQPYWVGRCDNPNGCEFATAEELVQAPIYQGRSLKERWNQVRIVEIEALSVDYWLEYYPQE